MLAVPAVAPTPVHVELKTYGPSLATVTASAEVWKFPEFVTFQMYKEYVGNEGQ